MKGRCLDGHSSTTTTSLLNEHLYTQIDVASMGSSLQAGPTLTKANTIMTDFEKETVMPHNNSGLIGF